MPQEDNKHGWGVGVPDGRAGRRFGLVWFGKSPPVSDRGPVGTLALPARPLKEEGAWQLFNEETVGMNQ